MRSKNPQKKETAIRRYIREQIDDSFVPLELILDNVYAEFEDEAAEEISEELRALAERLLVELSAERWREEQDWPETDNDRFDKVFTGLEQNGIIARQNFACCNTCGWAEIGDEIDQALEEGSDVIGCVFYHSQDTDSVRAGGTLYLAYGSVSDVAEDSLAIGRSVAKTLRDAGFTVVWDDDLSMRLAIMGFQWRRRWRPKCAYASVRDNSKEASNPQSLRRLYMRLRRLFDQYAPEWKQKGIVLPGPYPEIFES